MDRVQKELTKRIALVIFVTIAAVFLGGADSSSQSDINKKLAQIDINKATIEDVIRVLGEPIKYIWSGKTFTKDTLPSTYIAAYPNNFDIVLSNGKIAELRFKGPKAGYVYQGKLKVGSSLDEVLEVVGQPIETIEGQRMPKLAKDNVLYKNIGGRKGYCYYYYSCKDHGVQFYFLNYNVTNMTLTYPVEGRSRSFKTVQPITHVSEFDDVRWKDMSKLNLSDKKYIIPTLTFNKKTVWPESNKLPAGCDPNKLMTDAMNPGLGVRSLHQQGITGKGVNVAIIDQPVFLDHPEFKGKVVAYYDTGCDSQGSMHGPAVTSLLVGTNCGTAPDARVYYVAVPSWKRDTAYEARALDWIIEQNKKLPAGDKIRVVSVSAAPSGQGAPRDKNQYMWDQDCARAEAQEILVLDCTHHRGLIDRCWYDIKSPDNVVKCTPGAPGMPSRYQPGKILVPASPRTVAEEYDKGNCGYTYCGRAGLSWAIPYAAGVLALGWQICPDLTSEQMRDLLFSSAYTNGRGDKLINPVRFIQLVKEAKAPPKPPSSNAF